MPPSRPVNHQGFASCPFHQQALEAARAMLEAGALFKLEEETFETRDQYREW